MKGIILAGGSGTRLYPASTAVCKQLLPIYDKPMIYYPLSVLMQAGIRDILIISTPEDISRFEKLFGSGAQLGLSFQYAVQPKPQGIAQAFTIGASFIGNSPVCLILGDNIFYGSDLISLLQQGAQLDSGGLIFGTLVKDPKAYGVICFDDNHQVVRVEEKSQNPKSSYAIPGLYFYDSHVVEVARSILPSDRGELEITDIHNAYLAQNRLTVHLLSTGYAWLDAGTFDALHKASGFVQTIQERQGIKIACIEEIAYQMGYITYDQLQALAARFSNEYGDYLRSLTKERTREMVHLSRFF